MEDIKIDIVFHEKRYFTWQKLNEVYDSLDPRDYDDWPRKIMAIAKLCEDIPDNDLNRMSPEEWSCETCIYRLNCPRSFDEYLDEEHDCEYYFPDDEEIARLDDE